MVGTLSNILQLLKLPDGTVKVLVEGSQRSRVKNIGLRTIITWPSGSPLSDDINLPEQEIEVLDAYRDQYFRSVCQAEQAEYLPEVLNSLSGIDDPSRLADTIAAHMTIKIDEKQAILEMDDIAARLEHLMTLMEGEVDMLEMEKRIRGRVKQQMEKNQREYYLNEQMKAIQKELGRNG